MIAVETGCAARAAFTTRAEGDAREPEGRAAIAAALGIGPAAMAVSRQVHGAGVREVGPADAALAREGDGLVTGAAGVALMVLGADCLPILLWRADGARVGACHAGWRGLVAGVVEATVAALGGPDVTRAAIGPGIGACCYPVSAEVRDRFADRFGAGVVHGDRVDLAGAARAALAAAGVSGDRVASLGACTGCDEARFFSYRRDGDAAGRQAGVVWT